MHRRTITHTARQLYRVCAAIVLTAASAMADAGDSLTGQPSNPPRIATLHFNGNRITKAHILKMYSELDTGMLYDSIKVRRAKERLEATGLFQKVAIVPIDKKNGAVDLYIIVTERFYARLSALDFTPYTSRYGESDFKVCPLVGLEVANFRGRMETIRMSLRFWEWRLASIGWTKPLLPSRYYVGIGAFADFRPDFAIDLNRLEYAGSVVAGRRCFTNSRLYCSVSPDYQRKTTWDSLAIYTSHYYQAFGSIGWATDRRSPKFNPRNGWTLIIESRSNYLYHEKNTPVYTQVSSDVKLYHPGLFADHAAAYHAAAVYRTRDAGIQNRLTLGGMGSVRGYGIGKIDLLTSTNASLVFSAEYRFAIYRLESIVKMVPPRISRWMSGFLFDPSTLSPRIDGALIFDYGRIATNFESMISRGGPGYRSGLDIGFGLRLLEPTLRWSGCLDIVWKENLKTSDLDFITIPMWMLSLDLPF